MNGGSLQHCAKTYTRTQFHNAATKAFDGRDKATAFERRTLHRVIRCQRFAKSRPIIAKHLERYRQHHLAALERTRLLASGPRGIALVLLRDNGLEDQWSCLQAIVDRENSTWDPLRENGIGAHGLPQALPGSKMAAAGADWRTNPATQLRWLILIYVPPRYGTLCNAWAFWQAHGWY